MIYQNHFLIWDINAACILLSQLKNIPEIEKIIQYSFKDKSLLRQAFTRSSFCNEQKVRGKRGYSSNEVLEFFGDSVLSTSIISILMSEKTERYEFGVYTKLGEGDFSNIRSKLSDKRNLSLSISKLGLQKYLQMGEGDAKMGIASEPSVMEDLFESIIGAVYIDCGMDIKRVIGVVSKMLDSSSYLENSAPPIQSFKNALQEFCADKKRRLPPPVYQTVSESGPDHKKTYERAVVIGERVVAVGKGKNQKLADSTAAEAALEILKKEEDARKSAEKQTKKAASNDKTSVEIDENAVKELRDYATRKKALFPEFRDLGETEDSTVNVKEYAIECRCMGKSSIAKGKSKQDARFISAAEVLKILTKEENATKKKKTSLSRRSGSSKSSSRRKNDKM